MKILGRKQPVALLLGDLAALVVSLYLALALRYWALPSRDLIFTHLLPFSLLFVAWLMAFYIAGLYERQTAILRSRLPAALLNTLVINAVISIAFFYFVPFFGITPKTVLFIYLAISFGLVFVWRVYGISLFTTERRQSAYLIGEGNEVEELREEINRNPIYNMQVVSNPNDASILIVDMSHEEVGPILPDLYSLIFTGVRFFDLHKMYEDIFNRIPLSIIRYNWFIENISIQPRVAYDILKRLMDILISFPLLIISIILFPFIALAIKLDNPGPAFITQERFGQNNRLIKLLKFRSMERSESDKWIKEGDNRVTRVGKYIRNTRIDELPQLWNVLKGDISLIGPRPDIIGLGKKLQGEIPYYNVRNIVRPGLSGWAQINQEYEKGNISPQSVEETKVRLAYDLYYIKNRSFLLDLKIALRTIKTLLSRVGR